MTNRFAISRIVFSTALLLVAVPIAFAQPSLPDAWESSPYDDDTGEGTQNWFPLRYGAPQEHTIDSPADEDWFRVYDGPGHLVKVSLDNIVQPNGVQLVATAFLLDGPLDSIPLGEGETAQVGWFGEDRVALVRVRAVDCGSGDCLPLDSLDEPVSYTLSFGASTAPNNGVTGDSVGGDVHLSWGTENLKGAPQVVGFDVLRLAYGIDPDFQILNSGEPVPVPAEPGQCVPDVDETGCATYVDEDVEGGVFYLYRIDRRFGDGSTNVFTDEPNSVYVPLQPASVEGWFLIID